MYIGKNKMSIVEIWVKNFSQWPDICQGIFIVVVLSMFLGFITVIVRGYPNGKGGSSSGT